MILDVMPRVPGPGLRVADDGFPERWDSLCCDHVFSRPEADDVFTDILEKVEAPCKVDIIHAAVTTEPRLAHESAAPSVQTPRLSGTPRGTPRLLPFQWEFFISCLLHCGHDWSRARHERCSHRSSCVMCSSRARQTPTT